MPFGCLALRDGRTYDSISDVTDKYEIGQVLREFCELCLAKNRQTDKVFVCKKFLKKDGRKVRKAAKSEIMILKLVNHPNILQLIDTFETRKEYFIIQELATGGDVFDWILDQGNYTERDASNVIKQVLEAVAYLHSLNIVHRNLKLENLMYYTENNHNKVVLRDFYLSRFENRPITEPCGTPEYLAPEVVARHRYGRPVDCWAVGVIMYILLSGNPPFYDETEEENTDLHNRIIFCRIVAGDFEFDSPYWDDISPAAKDLVCRLMEVDQMLRLPAQDALWHEWIAGNGAAEKNLKDGVCAQFEKNFAKAKWRLSDGSSGTNLDKKHTSTSPDPSTKRKMAATLHGPPATASAATTVSPEKRPATQKEQKDETDARSGAGVDVGAGVRLRGNATPVGRRGSDTRRTDRYSAELSLATAGPAAGQGCYTVGSSASLGRHATSYNPEVETGAMGMAGSYGSSYSSLYMSGGEVGMYGTGLQLGVSGSSATSDWQMDSVIEQIEKQMAAVLEKIEGDMPSLLEQISDCPVESPRARSTHVSPATSRARSSQHSSTVTSVTPPPLPTSPRPALPSLPRLTIPPPSYPPPSPPTQASLKSVGKQEDRDGQRGAAHSSQSPRAGMGTGL
uniref:CaM kinase-like vesicle-associated protein n=1 Tax=Monopterus albus TaxID=43700 RepID=A0A3Q3JEA3_MONAL